MSVPQVGDILIRPRADTFLLEDAVTGEHVAGPLRGFMLAVGAARMRGARTIWQQNVDAWGQPFGDPFELPELPAAHAIEQHIDVGGTTLSALSHELPSPIDQSGTADGAAPADAAIPRV